MNRRALSVSLSLAICASAFAPSVAGARQASTPPRPALSRVETAALVKADLAKRLSIPAEAVHDIELVDEADREWADANLGCPGRKTLGEPVPVPGFAFTLAYGGRQFVYHSDRRGRFRPCEKKKPTAPLVR
jgi:hypothetical protein